MNHQPIKQTELFELEESFNEISNLFNSEIHTNKILLSGPKGSGKATLAYHLINYSFSLNEEYSYDFNLKKINIKNKSFQLVNNNSHPNFYLIDLLGDKKNIEISQIRKMIDYSNKSSFNGKHKFILIDNVENLNLNSLNSLLKVIEEPNEKVFFLLIHNSGAKIAPTLKSRCLFFKINLSFQQSINVTNKLIDNNIYNLLNKDYINYYNTPGDFVNLIKFSKDSNLDLLNLKLNDFLLFLLNENLYKNNNFIKHNIFNYIELFFLNTMKKSINKSKILNLCNNFTKKNYYAKKYNLDFESLFMEFKSKLLNE